MMIEIAQPPVAKPDRHYTVAGFPLHEAGGSAPGVTRNSWRSGCLVLHSVLPLVEFFKRVRWVGDEGGGDRPFPAQL
jgi:hypothetical protein